ncbi:hypothetical protein TDB9533_02025 [Thalassocella blandensis]|nr:hypothetical protein TDB9533_02025 [Thalassocella blandensis]
MVSFFVFFVILCAILGGGYWFWKRKEAGKSASESQIDAIIKLLPPLTTELFQARPDSWKSKDKLHEDEAKLNKIGAKHQGYYFTTDSSETTQFSFWNFKDLIGIVVKEETTIANELGVAKLNYGYEVFVKLKSGASFTLVTSDSATPGLPKSKSHQFALLRTNDIIALIKKAKAQIKDFSVAEKIVNAKAAYSDIRFAHSSWLWQEQQLLSNEMQVVLATSHITLDDDLLQSLLYYARFSLAESIEAQVLERFPKQAKLDEAKWAQMQDKVVVVHEKMPGVLVASALYQVMGNLTESQEGMLNKLEEQEMVENPLATFHEFYEKWNIKYKAKCIAKSKSPVQTEIYLKQ